MQPVTQMFFARQGTITPAMQRVAEREELPPETVPCINFASQCFYRAAVQAALWARAFTITA